VGRGPEGSILGPRPGPRQEGAGPGLGPPRRPAARIPGIRIAPLEIRLKKRKGNAKPCLCDPGHRASWLQEVVPLDAVGLAEIPRLGTLAGYLAESVAGYFLGNLPEIDSHRDTLGLRAFREKTVNNAPSGVLVTLDDTVEVRDPRIVALPLSSLLLMR
jgi:hypothetical protein